MADGFPGQRRAHSLLCAAGKKKRKKSNWARRLHRAAPLSCAGEPRLGSIFRRRAGGEKKRSPVAFNVGGRSLMRETHLESRHTSAHWLKPGSVPAVTHPLTQTEPHLCTPLPALTHWVGSVVSPRAQYVGFKP